MEANGKRNPFIAIDYLAKCAEFVMLCLTFLMVGLVTYQVFERYVLHYTPPWSEELAVYSMVWFGMIGIAIGVRTKAHMSLHFFADRMPLKVQRFIEYLKHVLILIYVSVLAYEGMGMVELTMPQTSPAMGIRVGLVYLALPTCAVLIGIFTLENIIREIGKDRGK